MSFEWDEAKNSVNRNKHGVDFAIAEDFEWDSAMWEEDRDSDEERYRAYGHAVDGRGYVIVFTFRGRNIRIISARRFTPKENRLYGY